MWLRSRGVTFFADDTCRFEYLGIVAPDRFVSSLQIIKEKWRVLSRSTDNGREVAALRLMLTRIGFAAVAYPAELRTQGRLAFP